MTQNKTITYIVIILGIVLIVGLFTLFTNKNSTGSDITGQVVRATCGDGTCTRNEERVGDCSTDCVGVDTDGDGLYDYQEGYGLYGSIVFTVTDAADVDSDDDGLTDGEEVITYGTSPMSTDTDGDTLSDYDEAITYGTNGSLTDTDGDLDQDPLEIEHGTDPNDATSYTQIPTPLLFVGGHDNKIYSLNADDGSIVSEVSSYWGTKPIFLYNELLHVSSMYLDIFDYTLTQVNSLNRQYLGTSSPEIKANGGVLYITQTSDIVAYDMTTQDKIWDTAFSFLGIRENFGYNPLIYLDDIIYAAGTSGVIYAIDARNMRGGSGSYDYPTILWTSDLRTVVGVNLFLRGLVEEDGILYTGDQSGYIYALDPTLATPLLWKIRSTTRSAIYYPIISDGVLYFGSSTYLEAMQVSAATGTTLWRFDTGGSVSGGFAIEDGVIYFGSDSQYIYAVDIATGTQIWSYFAGEAVNGDVLIQGDTLYVGGEGGTVFALKTSDGTLEWSTSISTLYVRAKPVYVLT